MGRTAIVFTPRYYAHATGQGHPENPRRLKAIMKELVRVGVPSNCDRCALIEPDMATLEELELVHTREHVQLVKRVCERGGGLLDLGDTVVSRESFEVARYAVGGAIKAADLVLSKDFRNAFALIRPPGHHAGPYYAMGFCLFNNVAVAASHLVDRLHLKRALILDVDAHHGNGTQEIFYGSKRILYISLHEDPQGFPGTGFIDEVGRDEGIGYNVNVPFPFEVSDRVYLQAIDEIVIPIASQYEPEFILISAGYDGYSGDPVANLSLSASTYAAVFQKILDLASSVCKDRLIAVLEGGYSLGQLGRIVTATISKMADFSYRSTDEYTALNPRAEERAGSIIEEVKRVQSAFWNLEV